MVAKAVRTILPALLDDGRLENNSGGSILERSSRFLVLKVGPRWRAARGVESFCGWPLRTLQREEDDGHD